MILPVRGATSAASDVGVMSDMPACPTLTLKGLIILSQGSKKQPLITSH